MPDFDPDAYIAEKTVPMGAAFNVDAYLRDKAGTTSTAPGAGETYGRQAVHSFLLGADTRPRIPGGSFAGAPAYLDAADFAPPEEDPAQAQAEFEAEKRRLDEPRKAGAAAHPVASVLGSVTGALPWAVMGPLKAPLGANLGGRIAINSVNGGVLNGLSSLAGQSADEIQSPGDYLLNAAKATGLGMVAGAALTPVGEALSAVAKPGAQLLQWLAGHMKTSSFRPTPGVAEAMASLPGGKAEVGKLALKEGVGGFTKGGVAESAGEAFNRQGARIGSAVNDAEALAGTPKIVNSPSGDWSTSGTGNPAELNAAVLKMERELAQRVPQEPITGESTRPEGLRAPSPSAKTAPGGPDAKAPDVSSMIADIRQRVLRPGLKEPANSTVGASARKADALLQEWSDLYAPEQASFETAQAFKKKLGDEAYKFKEAFGRTKDPAAGSYADLLQQAYSEVNQGIQSKMAALSPKVANEYGGANLDFRRAGLMRAAAERTAGRATSTMNIGLPDMVAGDMMSHATEAPGRLSGIPYAIANKILREHGNRVGSRLLYLMGGGNGAGEIAAGGMSALPPAASTVPQLSQLIQAEMLKAAQNDRNDSGALAAALRRGSP